MNYKDFASYQVLLSLGCKEDTGHLQAKKGIVSLVMPYGAHYHFNPNFKEGNVFFSRAQRQADGAGRTVFFLKEKGEDDYNLAFLAFILNWYNVRKINANNIFELIGKNKKKIFSNIFEGEE